MLAYSEWQKMCGGNMNIYIYDALHVGSSRYITDYLDCDKELIDIVVTGVAEDEPAKKVGPKWEQTNNTRSSTR